MANFFKKLGDIFKNLTATKPNPVLNTISYWRENGYMFQLEKNDSNTVSLTHVKEKPDKSADIIYNAVKAHIALTFKSIKNVIELDDKTNGKIIAKGWAFVDIKFYNNLHFTLIIDIKDNKFRVTFTDLILKDASSKYVWHLNKYLTYPPNFEERLRYEVPILKFANNFVYEMANAIDKYTNDNW